MKNEKVTVVCPKCGHEQQEPALAYSTRCKECREHFRLEDVLRPAKKVVNHQGGRKQVSCFKCNTELEVPVTAMSTMCKRCGSHVDLRDYTIANAVSKNFKTKGRFVIEQGGFLFNTESVAGEAVIKGRFLGNLRAERSLEIYSSAEIKGHLTTGLLILPEGQRFRWGETLQLGAAEIAGELVANVHAEGKVVVKANARVFGDIVAGNLVVEEGAVLVGSMKIGALISTAKSAETSENALQN